MEFREGNYGGNEDMSDDFHNKRMLHLMSQMPQYDEEGYDDIIAQVDFQMSNHPNPKKARRQNIKRAIKSLRPMKRSFFDIRRLFRGKYTAFKKHQCVVDCTNCTNSDYGDLFDQYFRDPLTMKLKPFKPWSKVIPGNGFQLDGTYCPQHLMLYHNLLEWLEQEDAESDPNFFSRMAKKGVAFIPIKRQKPQETEHPLIVKYTPVFIEMQKDGIPMMHFTSPGCPNCGHGKGQNDITIPIFDNRLLQSTAPTGNTLSTMDMTEYYSVIEQMGEQK